MAKSLDRGEKLYSTEHGHRTENVDQDPKAHAHREHVPGTMDITDHQRTFEGFIKFWIYLFGASILILIFLAIFNS